MDPDATFRELLEAIVADDQVEILDRADDLNDWMAKGGFAPSLNTAKNREALMLFFSRLVALSTKKLAGKA